MKLSLSVLVVLLLTLVHARPSLINRRVERGFRDNIAMGHGFGKRGESQRPDLTSLSAAANIHSPQSKLIKNSKLAALMKENPKLIDAVVAKFIDRNGDGWVSPAELFPSSVGDA